MNINSIYILGPFNTGTNLLFNMLNSNLVNVKDVSFNGLVWKHEFDINILLEIIKKNKHTLFVIMYKNIYNWIPSIIKSQYNLKWSKKITDGCELKNKKFDNIIQLYNTYHNNYIKLLNEENVIFLDYYKIIDRGNVKNYLNEKFKKFDIKIINENKIYKELSKPAKLHGKSVSNNIQALNKKQKNYEIYKNIIDNNKNLKKYVDEKIVLFFEK